MPITCGGACPIIPNQQPCLLGSTPEMAAFFVEDYLRN